jgi:hypothetical protein
MTEVTSINDDDIFKVIHTIKQLQKTHGAYVNCCTLSLLMKGEYNDNICGCRNKKLVYDYNKKITEWSNLAFFGDFSDYTNQKIKDIVDGVFYFKYLVSRRLKNDEFYVITCTDEGFQFYQQFYEYIEGYILNHVDMFSKLLLNQKTNEESELTLIDTSTFNPFDSLIKKLFKHDIKNFKENEHRKQTQLDKQNEHVESNESKKRINKTNKQPKNNTVNI